MRTAKQHDFYQKNGACRKENVSIIANGGFARVACRQIRLQLLGCLRRKPL
jgi:hypothetical protein